MAPIAAPNDIGDAESRCYLVGIVDTCVRKDYESACASLSASFVSFERWSSLCKVIRFGILASCANLSKQKRSVEPFWRIFLQWFVESDLLLLSFVQWRGWYRSLDWCSCTRNHWLLCLVGVWSYYHKYCLPDRVPIGWEAAGCAAKESFSFSKSLREAIVTVSLFVERETTLHDLPSSLGLLNSHFSSLTISRWIHMISLDFVIIGTSLLALCFSAIGLMTFNLALGSGVNPSWIFVFGKVPKLRVTMFAVTFFCSELKVKTPASTNS